MDNMIAPQIILEVEKDDADTLAAYMDEMERLNQLMREDQVEIDRLKTETQVIRTDMQALIAETQAIKGETRALQTGTRVVLDRLKAMV